ALVEDVVSTEAFEFDLNKVDPTLFNANVSSLVQIKPEGEPSEPLNNLGDMCKAVGLGIKNPDAFVSGRLVMFDFSSLAKRVDANPANPDEPILSKRSLPQFRLDLPLQLFTAHGHAITLRPVSAAIQTGVGYNGGHYTALINSSSNPDHSQWQWHDDSVVHSNVSPIVGGGHNAPLGTLPFPVLVFMRVV
ncbi:MAG TPA: hypothetical protein VFV39_05825, partial [Limnobacter sp.]|nr:hypothetical protein [Limnobacter sp.]